MGGCDKTTPALLMGAISMNLPAIFMPAGPMLRGDWRGVVLGSGSRRVEVLGRAARRQHHARTTGSEIEDGIARSPGHCMTMGTASTMTSAAEALGLTLPGAASIPAADSRHAQMATRTGRRIVEMVWEDLKPSDILSDASFDNAIDDRARARRVDATPSSISSRWRAAPASRSTSTRFDAHRAAHAGAREHPARRAST